MEKCHCTKIKFETVLEKALQTGLSYEVIAEEMGVSTICTACRDDLTEYCIHRLNQSR